MRVAVRCQLHHSEIALANGSFEKVLADLHLSMLCGRCCRLWLLLLLLIIIMRIVLG